MIRHTQRHCVGFLIMLFLAAPAIEQTRSRRPSARTTQTKPRAWRNKIGMEFVLIPSSSFRMGSNHGDADEKPVHDVIISKDFYMGKFEVTQEQWRIVMGVTLRQQSSRRELLGA